MPHRSRGSRFLHAARAHVRGRLWFIPGASAIGAMVLAKSLPWLDDGLSERQAAAWYLFPGQAESARSLLSTIAAAMMTFTGLVFSITILVLQLASQQFSPRILRTFLEDRSTQIAMATFIGTFVYAMALLPEVRGADAIGGERVPAFAVFLSFAFVMASVGVFVRYIDAMAQSIRAVHVLRRVADDGSASITRLYPDAIANDADERSVDRERRADDHIVPNDARSGGVVAAVDADALLEIAKRADVAIELLPRLGDFVARGAPLFRVFGSSAAKLDPADMRAAVTLADERSTHQDPSFAFRQLVDVAERALSPGINDPTTAVQAIDRIQDLLTALASRAFPPAERADDTGALRLILHRPSWDDLVHLAFDEIRIYGRSSLQVVRRLRQALEALRSVCPPSRTSVIDEELRALDRALDAFEDHDRSRAAMASAQG